MYKYVSLSRIIMISALLFLRSDGTIVNFSTLNSLELRTKDCIHSP